MDTSGDIYSKEKDHKKSPWKNRHHRETLIDSNAPEKKADEKQSARRSERGDASRRHLKRKRSRRVLISLGIIVLLAYIGYTGLVALKGALGYGGIRVGDISLRGILKGGTEPGGPQAQTALEPSSDQLSFGAEGLIEKIDKSVSIEMDVRSLLDRGLAAQALSRVEDAGANLLASNDLNKMIVRAHMIEGNYEKALDLLKYNLVAEPDDADSRIQMAELLARLEDFEGAIAVADWTLRADVNSDQARRIMAESYAKLGMSEQSIAEYRKILTRNPEDDETRSKLALAYYDGGQYGRAVNLLNDMIKRGTENSLAYYNLSICYARQGLVDEAVDILMRATRKFGNAFVRAWIQGVEFNDIRNVTKFIMFASSLESGPDVANMRAREAATSRKDLQMGVSPVKLDDRSESLLNRDR